MSSRTVVLLLAAGLLLMGITFQIMAVLLENGAAR